MSDEAARRRARDLMREGATPQAVVSALINECGLDLRGVMQAALDEILRATATESGLCACGHAVRWHAASPAGWSCTPPADTVTMTKRAAVKLARSPKAHCACRRAPHAPTMSHADRNREARRPLTGPVDTQLARDYGFCPDCRAALTEEERNGIGTCFACLNRSEAESLRRLGEGCPRAGADCTGCSSCVRRPEPGPCPRWGPGCAGCAACGLGGSTIVCGLGPAARHVPIAPLLPPPPDRVTPPPAGRPPVRRGRRGRFTSNVTPEDV